jgi:hypothetical protein
VFDVYLMVFNATFNNISVISWGPGENHRPVASHWQILIHNVVHFVLIEIRTSVVIGTDYIGSCKSNYNTITATTAPNNVVFRIDCESSDHGGRHHVRSERLKTTMDNNCVLSKRNYTNNTVKNKIDWLIIA